MGPKAAGAVPALITAMGNRDLANSVAEALGKIGPKAEAAIPALLKALGDDPDGNGNLVRRAATALGKIGVKAVPGLIKALAHKHWRTRLRAADTLGTFGPASKAAINPLIKALENDKSSFVKEHAATALGDIGPAAWHAGNALRRALSSNHSTKLAAIRALGQIGFKRAVSDLKHIRKTGSSREKKAAAKALHRLGAKAP